MTWTETDEFELKTLLSRRKQHEATAAEIILVAKLRELADAIEGGKKPILNLQVEFLRNELIGYPFEMSPPYGMRYTFEVINK